MKINKKSGIKPLLHALYTKKTENYSIMSKSKTGRKLPVSSCSVPSQAAGFSENHLYL